MKTKSPRLAKIHEYLLLNGSATTREIQVACDVCGVRDYIRRLRDNGVKIETIEERTTETGARVVRYKLLTNLNQAVDFPHGVTGSNELFDGPRLPTA